MKIQIAHSRAHDFKNEIYLPIKKSKLWTKHTIILPHDENEKGVDSKTTLKSIDVLLAEVSRPSTGVGIELGFANIYGTKIICFHKVGKKISGSLHHVCKTFFTYKNQEELIEKIEKHIQKEKRQND